MARRYANAACQTSWRTESGLSRAQARTHSARADPSRRGELYLQVIPETATQRERGREREEEAEDEEGATEKTRQPRGNKRKRRWGMWAMHLIRGRAFKDSECKVGKSFEMESARA